MNMFSKIRQKFFPGNIIYYPGCLSKFGMPIIGENYKKILRRLKIDFIELNDAEFCCGSPALNAGYKKDFKDLIEKNLKVFKEYGVDRIITACPACYNMFNFVYPKYNKEWNIKAEHISTVIWNKIKNKSFKLLYNDVVTYHDPCHLGRHSNIYEEPRKILEKVGFTIKEMKNNRKRSLCCGAGGGLKNNNAQLADRVAKLRIKQAKDIDVKKIITSCSMCYLHMKENTNLEVKELSEVLVNVI